MNRYFAKYLPVEGEIKEGDKICWSIEFNHIIGFEGGIKHAQLLQKDNYKAVKPFLCSRDIQVGDRMWSKIHGELKEYTYTKTIDFDKVPSSYSGELDSTCFKVIGEISPQAVWVKEGDELDKENILLDSSRSEFDNSGNLLARIYQIKCPTCKTFH